GVERQGAVVGGGADVSGADAPLERGRQRGRRGGRGVAEGLGERPALPFLGLRCALGASGGKDQYDRCDSERTLQQLSHDTLLSSSNGHSARVVYPANAMP